ncbi:hypothetical protein ACIPPM_02140 [Streptomyces sp. NPDC090119]|uniref:hypothetical protein n=1 Tax=Streptomyces sp. NPDC090119 TaxID=3365951 RepID=UPI003813B900
MMTNAKIGTALVGGYLLGRTKKAKLAIGLGMFLAGKKLSLDPQQLGRLVAGSPLLSGLTEQVRDDLLTATRSAASTALTSRVNQLSESLSEKAHALREPAGAAGDKDPEDEYEDEGEAPDDEDAPAEPRRRRSSGARSETRAARGAKSASSGSGTARSGGAKTRGTKGTARTAKAAPASRPARKQRQESDRG